MRGNRSRQSKVIGGGQAIDDDTRLVTSCDSIYDRAHIRCCRLSESGDPSEASPQTAEKHVGSINHVVKFAKAELLRDPGEPSDVGRCAAV